MEKHYIYKLTSPSGKTYIGRSKNFNSRLTRHLFTANSGYQHPLYDSIRKHGWDNFTKEIIAEVVGHDTAYKTELFYINLFDTVNNGLNLQYNTKDGGDVWTDRKDTPEYDDFVKKMRVVNSHSKMHGKHHSDEAKAKQKAAAVGRYSLDWFIQRHGTEEGTIKYEERRLWLKTRNLKKDENGRFIKG